MPEQYDEDFKKEAVRLASAGDRTVGDVARSLGISENLLYRWKGDKKTNPPSNCTVAIEEYERVREQLRRVEQEREVLKKALAIFSGAAQAG
ncbi:transposase [Larkinella arboricola]|uniref:transposase n=1 Tax=Larkinella arboricola TaxID=643671 RepID=UPI000DB9098E|nr:transposase [Larkinella arboricola]